MEDKKIVELFLTRDENAISESDKKYGRYCFSIANNILHNNEDSQECVNDTYLGAWNAIPPHEPEVLSTFLGKITRRLSIKKWRSKSALKRGSGLTEVSLDELEDCIPAGKSVDESVELSELTRIINAFLENLSCDERRIFVRRYWYCDSINDISTRFSFSESKVKMTLKRTRGRLENVLNKGGYFV